MLFIPVMAKHSLLQSSASHYPSAQLLLSMLKTDVLLNIYVETMIYFFQDSLMNRKLSICFFVICLYCITINVFNITFDQFNTSLAK